ncbi:MAG: hypothetical protein Q7S26_02335 [bacterium]|nr:hypothetical protein [bacterium]
MTNTWKYVAGVVVVLLLAGGGYYLLQGKKSISVVQEGGSVAVQIATSTYTGAGFSIVYPANYMVDAAYAYDQFGPKKLINGVKFTIPASMATGTNLGTDSYLSVESLPHAKNCTGDIYLLADVKAQTIPENSVQYSVATNSGAGAGNMYEETVYAIEGSVPCTAVRYSVHSSSIDNYPVGTVREFDRMALLAAFDTIRQSLILSH